MSRSVHLCLLSLLVAASVAGCSSIQTMKPAAPTVLFGELEADPAKYGFGADKDGKPRFPRKGVVIKIPKGDKIPLQLAMDVTIATLEPGKNWLRFDRDVLLYIAHGEFKISPDGRRWAAIHDVKAIKKLFGMKGRGHFGFGFGISKEKGAGFHVSVSQGGR